MILFLRLQDKTVEEAAVQKKRKGSTSQTTTTHQHYSPLTFAAALAAVLLTVQDRQAWTAGKTVMLRRTSKRAKEVTSSDHPTLLVSDFKEV
jgi:hypothetical protein